MKKSAFIFFIFLAAVLGGCGSSRGVVGDAGVVAAVMDKPAPPPVPFAPVQFLVPQPLPAPMGPAYRLPPIGPPVLGVIPAPSPAPVLPPDPRTFVALGDSVSSGFGLPYYAGVGSWANGRHSVLVFEALRDVGLVDYYLNLAVSGYTTADVLEMLLGMDAAGRAAMQDARVVTINIGGNNILTPFLAYLADTQGGTSAERVVGGAGVLWEAISVYGFLDGAVDVARGLFDIIAGGWGVAAAVPHALDVLGGQLSAALEAALEAGVNTFTQELGQLLNWLAFYAPYATVIVNTVYNPIPPHVARISIELSTRAGELIDAINHTIRVQGLVRGLYVAEVSYYLDNHLALMQFNLNPWAEAISFDIIHPNAAGHRKIAGLHLAFFP